MAVPVLSRISNVDDIQAVPTPPLPTPSPPPQQQPQQQQQQQSRLNMEGVFFRLHSRLVHLINRWTSPTSRTIIEFLILINAFALLVMLCWFHVKYVSRAESNCVTQVLRRELESHLATGNIPPQVVKLHVSGIWSHLGREDAKSSEKLTKVIHAPPDGTLVAANLFKVWLQDPVYVYSSERGFLMLDESTRQQFKINEASIRLRTEAECFADSLIGETERYLLDNFIGYDTVILNAFGALFDSKGFLYSVHSRELLNVANVHSNNASSSRASTLAFKMGAVATTLFLFFITTTLVHHTLRETQERMLKFTVDLQYYVRRGLGYRHLVFNHVVGSLVFVPIMVGMLFFLFEFFNDQLLAFMVLAVVWVCELFSVMSLRTAENLSVFPRLFFLYFCSFHLYFFLFPSGFSYMALTSCVVFLQHFMLSFFFRYEMPALLSGRITVQKQREILSGNGEFDTAVAYSLMDPNPIGSLAVRALGGSSRVNSLSSLLNNPNTSTITGNNNTNSASIHAMSTISSGATTLSNHSLSQPQPSTVLAAAPPPVAAATSTGTTPTNASGAAAANAFFARPARRKRSTIHAEPQETGNGESNSGTSSPPVLNAPPPLSVGPPPRWPENTNNNNLNLDSIGGDDNSSQTSGWEIGGYAG